MSLAWSEAVSFPYSLIYARHDAACYAQTVWISISDVYGIFEDGFGVLSQFGFSILVLHSPSNGPVVCWLLLAFPAMVNLQLAWGALKFVYESIYGAVVFAHNASN